MLTKTDLQLIDNLVKSHIDNLIESHIYPLQNSQESLVENFERKFTDFKSEILDAIDDVMREIKAMREEQIIANSKLSDHEDRLENLETKVGVSV